MSLGGPHKLPVLTRAQIEALACLWGGGLYPVDDSPHMAALVALGLVETRQHNGSVVRGRIYVPTEYAREVLMRSGMNSWNDYNGRTYCVECGQRIL